MQGHMEDVEDREGPHSYLERIPIWALLKDCIFSGCSQVMSTPLGRPPAVILMCLFYSIYLTIGCLNVWFALFLQRYCTVLECS